MRLETIFGKIRYKFGKGFISSKIISELNFKAAEKQAVQQHANQDEFGEIDGLVMIDRTCDMLTPFCTP
jgi:hypothetical protein